MIGIAEIQGSIPVTWNKNDIPIMGWNEDGDVGVNSLYTEAGHLPNAMTIAVLTEQDLNFPKWADIRKYFLELDHSKVWMHSLFPGTYLPLHSDGFTSYKKEFELIDEKIARIIIFCEDWQPGQISDVNHNLIYNWKAGDYVGWYDQTPHAAYNFSMMTRYAIMITGTVKPGIKV